MPYWNCYYHVVWATKYRQPIITPQYESLIFSAVQQKSHELRCPVLALNGTSDHLHIAVCITPSISIAMWVGHVKGLSAHAINATFGDQNVVFKWQEGYGVVTFGEKNLPFVKAYIAQQKIHHADGKLIAKLEQIEDD